MAKDIYTAIVLQGGGALGAYECGVMKGLFESRPDLKPDVITGISIGAVNAAILAGAEDPIPVLEEVWREFGKLPPAPFFEYPFGRPFLERAYELLPATLQQFFMTFGNQGMYRIRPAYLLNPLVAPLITDSICETQPLRNTLKRYVDPDRLNSSCQVVVSAVNVETGQLEKFGNAASMRDGGSYDNNEALSIDHILASGSLPPGFPMTCLKDDPTGACRYYWDGGINSNTPLSEAINCLERCGGGRRDVKRRIIVVELFPMEGPKPENIRETYSRFFSMIFASKLKLDQKLFSDYSSFIDLVGNIDFLLKAIDADDTIKKKLDQALASGGRGSVDTIHHDAGFENLIKRRRIDEFRLIPFQAHEYANPLDFSKGAIEARIRAGKEAGEKYFVPSTPVPEIRPERAIKKKAA